METDLQGHLEVLEEKADSRVDKLQLISPLFLPSWDWDC